MRRSRAKAVEARAEPVRRARASPISSRPWPVRDRWLRFAPVSGAMRADAVRTRPRSTRILASGQGGSERGAWRLRSWRTFAASLGFWGVSSNLSSSRREGPSHRHVHPDRTNVPNPAGMLKFLPGRELLTSGTARIPAMRPRRAPHRSPKHSSHVPGVVRVFFAGEYLTVSKAEDQDWVRGWKASILAAIMDHFTHWPGPPAR